MTTPVWTWKAFEAEAQKALAPFNPEHVSLCRYPGNAPAGDDPVWPETSLIDRRIICYALQAGPEGWSEGCFVHVDQKIGRLAKTMLTARLWRHDDALTAVGLLTRIIWTHECPEG